MRSQEMRQVALEYLARGVPAAQLRFDPQTGRFLSDNGGWAVTHQDVILPLAPGGPAKKFRLTVTDVPGQQDDR